MDLGAGVKSKNTTFSKVSAKREKLFLLDESEISEF